MASRMPSDAQQADGYIRFWTAGSAAKGEFHCAECSYGVTIYRELPVCPMCGGTAWEQMPWSPLTRASRRAELNA